MYLTQKCLQPSASDNQMPFAKCPLLLVHDELSGEGGFVQQVCSFEAWSNKLLQNEVKDGGVVGSDCIIARPIKSPLLFSQL